MPTFVYSDLKAAAFPGSGHPDALVHIPEHFDPTHFGLCIYLHGFDNCIENVAAAPPGIHSPPQPCADLINQLEGCGRSTILLLPETRYHARSAEPGQLGDAGGFLRLWQEVHERLRTDYPALAASSPMNVESVVLISHSGGYRAAARIARDGGLLVGELCLLDSLYGDFELFAEIALEHVADHASGQEKRRLVNLFREGGTDDHARAQADQLRTLLAQHSLADDLLFFDDSVDEPTDAQLSRPLVVKRVATEHSDFGRTYVGTLLRTSRLPFAE